MENLATEQSQSTLTLGLREDADLARNAMAGDAEAFVTLVVRHQNMARTVAYQASGHWDSVDDLTQDAMLIAWTKISDLQDPEKFRPWLACIVRNAAHNQRRHQRRHAPRADGAVQVLEELPSTSPSPLQIVQSNQRWEVAKDAIANLSGRYREALLLYFSLGESHREVALALGLSEVNARQRLARARKKLKGEIEEISKQGRALARHSIRAASIVLLLRSQSAWGSQGVAAAKTTSVSAFSVAFGASMAILTCVAAIFMLYPSNSGPADSNASVPLSPTSSPNTLSQAESMPIGKTLLSPNAPKGLVHIGNGQTDKEANEAREVPLSTPSSKSSSVVRSRPHSAAERGTLTAHGPAIVQERPKRHLKRRALEIPLAEPAPRRVMMKPSADLSALRNQLIME